MTRGEHVATKWLADATARVEQARAGGNPAAVEAAKSALRELRAELQGIAKS
jgi:hypothetical protein